MTEEKRQNKDRTRREFIGFGAKWAVLLSSLAAFAGILRFTKANVHYEESKKFKIGTADNHPVGSINKFEDKNVYIFSDNDGLHAISGICTHLGCIVALSENGFQCPCHGSKFNREGKVTGGPAPRNLPWLEISRNVDGTLVVDAAKEIQKGTIFKV